MIKKILKELKDGLASSDSNHNGEVYFKRRTIRKLIEAIKEESDDED